MLVIGEKTVERHRTKSLEKLAVRDRVELTNYAIRRGLIAPRQGRRGRTHAHRHSPCDRSALGANARNKTGDGQAVPHPTPAHDRVSRLLSSASRQHHRRDHRPNSSPFPRPQRPVGYRNLDENTTTRRYRRQHEAGWRSGRVAPGEERRRAVALAYHYREAEGLSIAQIAHRLGRAPATIKAYFYDPTGEKARAVKARYQGVCRGCGAYTQPRNGKGDAYRYCKRCHPGAAQRKWTQELVAAAVLDWLRRYGRLPSSYDWSRTQARRRGGIALKRLNEGKWPPVSVFGELFGSWQEARGVAAAAARADTDER
jgi:hypothetical protein